MTPLEKVKAMKMPFAELKGVEFVEAEQDRVVARMTVRPDLCTLYHTIHGGAVMAFADSVGAAATVINLPEGAKGTTTLESKTNFSSEAPRRAPSSSPPPRLFTGVAGPRSGPPGWRLRTASWLPW
ncbi:acyl-coenzyme A thioesterase PaaI-like protein [Bradyrhizobium sp. USDA 4448]